MRTIKVLFEDGDHLTTGINGTEVEIRKYYEGNTFNLGDGAGGDRMVKALSVEFLDKPKAKLINIKSLTGTAPGLRVDLRTRDKDGAPIYECVQPDPIPGTLLRVEVKKAGPVCGGGKGPKVDWLYWYYTPEESFALAKNPAFRCGYSGQRVGSGEENLFLEVL